MLNLTSVKGSDGFKEIGFLTFVRVKVSVDRGSRATDFKVWPITVQEIGVEGLWHSEFERWKSGGKVRIRISDCRIGTAETREKVYEFDTPFWSDSLVTEK